MKLNPHAVLPSTEVLRACRDGLTSHIRKAKATIEETREPEIKSYFEEKLHRLRIIKKEIQFLINELNY
jgi:hypothetical protein